MYQVTLVMIGDMWLCGNVAMHSPGDVVVGAQGGGSLPGLFPHIPISTLGC